MGGQYAPRFEYKDTSAWNNTEGSTHQHDQHERLLFVLMNMVGMKVEVTCRGGVVYEGIYAASHNLPNEKELGVALKMARKKVDGKVVSGEAIKQCTILAKDVCAISAKDMDMSFSEKSNEREGFQTDTAISGGTGPVRERELQKWAPSGDDDLSLGLEYPFHTCFVYESGNSGKWDQFAVNEKLFGVSTDFDEHLYTTTLDKSDPDFRRREAEAIRLAAEIERSPAANIHIAEERNLSVDDSNVDEEDRYSSVIRQQPGPGKYVPPAVRRTLSNQPSRGQLQQPQTKSPAPLQTQQNPPHPKAEKNKPEGEAGKTLEAKDAKKDPKEGADSTAPVKEPKGVKFNDPKELRNLDEATFVKPPPGHLAKLLEKKPAQGPPSPLPGKGDEPPPSEKVARLFKDFAHGEKKSLLQRKQALMKKEKDGIINEFKSFSASLKLKTPMPSDLQEILNKPASAEKKDSESSEAGKSDGKTAASKNDGAQKDVKSPKPPVAQIAKKESQDIRNQSPLATPKPKPRDMDTSSVASNASSTAATTASKSEFKFNLDAAEFRPTGSFTPATTTTPSTPSQVKSPPHGDKSPFFGNKRLSKGQTNYPVNKQPYSKGFQKNAGTSPKPNQVFNHYVEDNNMYPPGVDPQQFQYPYPMAYHQYRPMMGRPPFVPVPPMSMSMAPAGAIPAYIPYAPGFAGPVPPGAHVYQPQMLPPPPGHQNMRMFPKGQIPAGFIQDENGAFRPAEGYQSPPVSSPAGRGGPPFMSPPPMYSAGPMMAYPPEMMQFQHQPHMMMHAPHPGQVWAPEQMPMGEMAPPPPESPSTTAPPQQPAEPTK
ncbi:hypothetical protein HK104_004744 [Borealophlyctis nickersoniae]|nr:hypothetical protein HK104_004744 [Borealophlyctis nickersoniae]